VGITLTAAASWNPVEVLKIALFLARGRRPFTTGYSVYKERHIARVLAARRFDPQQLEPGYGVRLDERIVEYPWLFSRLPSRAGRLLDAGSTLNFDFLLGHDALRTKQIVIMTLAPERRCERMRAAVSYVYGDLRSTGFRDGWFDWVASLSTLEHVGLDNTRFYTRDPTKREAAPCAHLEVVAELHRVLRPGGTLYVTVPFGLHRDHGWLQVFDAAMVDAVLRTFRPASFIEHHFRYERDGWRPSSRQESREATYFDYHAGAKHDEDYAAAARAVVCLELVK
jgi:SAM-dependent methyltransferase